MSERSGPERSIAELGRVRRQLLTAILALLSLTTASTLALMAIEGWGAWDSLFFTLITPTTVGYGDQGLSEAGRKFTTILLVLGIAVASYTFALIVQWAVSEGARVAFVAPRRPGDELQISPRGTEVLRAKDVLIVAGDPVQISLMRERAARVQETSTETD